MSALCQADILQCDFNDAGRKQITGALLGKYSLGSHDAYVADVAKLALTSLAQQQPAA
jgi:hypothetical protein